jgi:hypothetical protein
MITPQTFENAEFPGADNLLTKKDLIDLGTEAKKYVQGWLFQLTEHFHLNADQQDFLRALPEDRDWRLKK